MLELVHISGCVFLKWDRRIVSEGSLYLSAKGRKVFGFIGSSFKTSPPPLIL